MTDLCGPAVQRVGNRRTNGPRNGRVLSARWGRSAGRGQSFFDPLAYRPITDARFGTAGFNSLRGPGIVNLDMGVFRQFRIQGRLLRPCLNCRRHSFFFSE